LPDATVHASVPVSSSEENIDVGRIYAQHVADDLSGHRPCPCPWGVVAVRTVIPPSGLILTVAPSALPDFGSVSDRSAAVWASVM